MLIRIVVVAVAVLTVACATPYQSKGFSGGFKERDLGNGRWFITFDGNSYTGRSTVMEYTYRRAGELCPAGFDVLDADRDSSTHVATFDGGQTYTATEKPGAVLVVQCRGAMHGPRSPTGCRGELCPK